MRKFLRQSTASQTVLIGPFLDDTDYKTPETGLTIANTDVDISKNGATATTKNSGGGTHRMNGNYSFTFNATDTDTLGELAVSIPMAGALPVEARFEVIEASLYDLMFASTGPVPHLGIVDRGTAQAATSTTTTLRAAAAFADNVLANCVLYAFGSTQGYWQAVQITSNVGSTDVCTHPAWPVTPSGTITYYVAGVPGANSSLPVPANTVQWNNTAVPAPHTNGYPIVTVKDGTGTGEIDTASGKVSIIAGDISSIQSGLATSAALSGVEAKIDTIDNFVDTEIAAILAAVDTEIGTLVTNVAAILADTSTDGVVLSTAQVNVIRDAIFARAFNAKMSSLTFEELTALMACVLLGKMSGLESTTVVSRNLADNANATSHTVDEDGNRSAATLNAANVR